MVCVAFLIVFGWGNWCRGACGLWLDGRVCFWQVGSVVVCFGVYGCCVVVSYFSWSLCLVACGCNGGLLFVFGYYLLCWVAVWCWWTLLIVLFITLDMCGFCFICVL